MLHKNPKKIPQSELFKVRLDDIVDDTHELVKLGNLIDWEGLALDLSSYYCLENGRPGNSIRLMAGLCFLKDIKGISDEELCATWRENPYFQHFCGEVFFCHDFPIEPPSLSIFRKRIGEEGMERLLQETVKLGLATGVVKKSDFEVMTIDTTVQEKAVKFPTDTQLCHRAREELVSLAKEENIPLRQSYKHKSKKDVFMANRYSFARQPKRAKERRKNLKNYLGRVQRDIERAAEKGKTLSAKMRTALDKATIIYNQTLKPKAKEKLYSWHAPEVECIAKGKSSKKYEYGVKASYAVTNKSNFVIGALAFHGRPYDGKTLEQTVRQASKLTGAIIKEVYVDRGYRGYDLSEGIEVVMAGQKRGITPAKRKRQKRRNAIEPIIGHAKNDRKVGARNWLKDKIGDKINVIAMAIGFNLRKILKKIFFALFRILFFLFCSYHRRQISLPA